MFHDLLRTDKYKRPEYPVPSRCWLCGRFGNGPRSYPQRKCLRCDVTWYSVMPGIDPAAPVNRDYEMDRLRGKYLPRGHVGRPWDYFDDFIDHGEVKLASPA